MADKYQTKGGGRDSGVKSGTEAPPSQTDQLDYIGDLIGELERMASAVPGASTLTGLLTLAKLEAQRERRRTGRDGAQGC